MKMPRFHPQIEELKSHLRALGVEWVEEHRFHPVRRWRLDLAVPAVKIGIEYQGHAGMRGGGPGGHTSISGLTRDCEKNNAAIALGWRVLTFTALHFTARSRAAHKLEPPREALARALEVAGAGEGVDRAEGEMEDRADDVGGTPTLLEGEMEDRADDVGGTPTLLEGGGTPTLFEGEMEDRADDVGGTPTLLEVGGTPTLLEVGGTPTLLEVGGTPTLLEVGGTPRLLDF